MALKNFKQFLATQFPSWYSRLAIFVVIALPLVYAVLYLWAFWDPYSKVENLPVAFVNQDQGGVKDGETQNLGDELEDELRDNHDLAWSFTSLEEAEAGLQEKRYYSYILIPADFTQKILSVDGNSPEKAHLILKTREATNSISSRIVNRAAYEITEKLGHKISEEYFDNIFIESRNSAEDLKKAVDGTQELKDGLGDAYDGSVKLHDGLSDAYQGTYDLSTGLYRLYDGSVTLRDRIKDAYDGSEKLVTGARKAYRAADQLSTGLDKLVAGDTTLNAGLTQVTQGANDLTAALGKARDQTAQLSEAAKQGPLLTTALNSEIQNTATSLNTADTALQNFLSAHPEFASDPDLLSVQTEIATARLKTSGMITLNGKLSGLQTILQGSLTALANGLSQLYSASAKLAVGLTQLSSGSQSIAQNLPLIQEGEHKLTDGLKTLVEGQKELSEGLDKLYNGADELRIGVSTAYDGTNTLYDGIRKLKEGSLELANGLSDAREGSTELHDRLNDGYVEAVDKTEASKVERQKPVLANPVEFNEELIDPVKTYGTGFAPYFIPLSLWVGSLAIFFVLEPLSNQEARRFKRFGLLAEVLKRYLLLAVVGVLQAVILDRVLIEALHLEVNHLEQFYLFSILIALLFVAISQFLSYLFGHAGNFVGVVLLMLQLTSSAGTYPKETLPGFFLQIAPYLPMTYSVPAMRDIISGSQIDVRAQLQLFVICILCVLFANVLLKKIIAELTAVDFRGLNLRYNTIALWNNVFGRSMLARLPRPAFSGAQMSTYLENRLDRRRQQIRRLHRSLRGQRTLKKDRARILLQHLAERLRHPTSKGKS